ncbi:MAG: hypothetical protein O2816_16110 [Planctomycetota bacterium]|nr:hypothetical protein [Planctomycetota bacterium]
MSGGQTGQVLHVLSDAAWEPNEIAAAGNANGNGTPDLLVGEPFKSRV